MRFSRALRERIEGVDYKSPWTTTGPAVTQQLAGYARRQFFQAAAVGLAYDLDLYLDESVNEAEIREFIGAWAQWALRQVKYGKRGPDLAEDFNQVYCGGRLNAETVDFLGQRFAEAFSFVEGQMASWFKMHAVPRAVAGGGEANAYRARQRKKRLKKSIEKKA